LFEVPNCHLKNKKQLKEPFGFRRAKKSGYLVGLQRMISNRLPTNVV